MDPISGLDNITPEEIDRLYDLFAKNPDLLTDDWKYFFAGFDFGKSRSENDTKQKGLLAPDEFKVLALINAFRERGHYFTLTNPVRKRRAYSPTLDPENFGLSTADSTTLFRAGQEVGLGPATLGHIRELLQTTYCRSVGVEYMYIRRPEIVEWLKQKMESGRNLPSFTPDEKRNILHHITRAVDFEKFIHTRFPGQKSFSLEGAESLIPALACIIERGADTGCHEFIIGMPHRGRLNVLANIMHKSYSDIFSEFEGKPFSDFHLLGDVKYHLGYSSDYQPPGGKTVHLTLSPNPSHLEAVGPVVEGIARAKLKDASPTSVVPIVIHGDASIAGQGVVYEVVQMSELKGYHTGGTIHVVVNNQLGFTTNYLDGRSSIYCTDVAKIIQSPIFHVNGDDVEAVVYTMLLAFEYRQTFRKDVFVDLLCYRKYGHNESDEPRFTQPLLYKTIEKHPDPKKIYLDKLSSEGVLSPGEIRTFEKAFTQNLEADLDAARQKDGNFIKPFLADQWTHLLKPGEQPESSKTDTAVEEQELKRLAGIIATLPPDKPFFRKIAKLQADRAEMLSGTGRIDWAMAELLAYASLLSEGFSVRISGQDVKRGTFSHRHAVLTLEDSEEEFTPLSALETPGVTFEIHNSLLSEYAVLGFEYGYALAMPQSLNIWEAQFGDFGNGAQIIFDQFIASAEEKWNISNGLVMLLPHGYEGQGPEHSSARIERYLSLCAGRNIQVANCTTPAGFFHLLRRQMKRNFRKPLVVFTPKSLLRHPFCISGLTDFTLGGFSEVLDDELSEKNNISRIILCSGKIFYELDEFRKQHGITDTAILRLEQLYPFPSQMLGKMISQYPKGADIVWVQEEPGNMGAWPFVGKQPVTGISLAVTRPESGSPATGSSQWHKAGQQKICDKAFGRCSCENKQTICNMKCSANEKKF